MPGVRGVVLIYQGAASLARDARPVAFRWVLVDVLFAPSYPKFGDRHFGGIDTRCGMPNQLTISAIVPLYNGAKYIEEALNSILAQSRKPNEIIIIDDGSTDNGPDIVKRMAAGNRVVLLRKPNGGQSSARNFGIAHSVGDLIALLDQDDAWYPNHLEQLAKPFGRLHFPELGWVYSNLDEMDAHGRMVRRYLLSSLPATHPKRDLIEQPAEDGRRDRRHPQQ
jgi:glycosyltransferase involved in cell wall biosynthesis